MKVLLDLNVLLDVFQQRQPHYLASARVLSRILDARWEGVVPGHGITTIYYLLARYVDRQRAEAVVDWMIARFQIAPVDKTIFAYARQLQMTDFEDAVVAALAERTDCDYVVTRNVDDFAGSPVYAITPLEILSL